MRAIYSKDTPYQRLTVAESASGDRRYLYSKQGDEKQGGISLGNPLRLHFEYCKVSLLSLAFLGREPRAALFVGLGAGSLPGYLSRYYPSARLDIAELDPDVLDVARRFFHFSETESMRVHIADGRAFVRGAQCGYDIVFLDAYQENEIPRHLSTVEFLEEVKAKLSAGGVVAANIVAREKNGAFDAMAATYRRVFPHAYVFEGISSYNNVLVAASGPVGRDALVERARRIQKEKRMDVKLTRLAERPFYSLRPKAGASVLTDLTPFHPDLKSEI